jgi:hypothetical protein
LKALALRGCGIEGGRWGAKSGAAAFHDSLSTQGSSRLVDAWCAGSGRTCSSLKASDRLWEPADGGAFSTHFP